MDSEQAWANNGSSVTAGRVVLICRVFFWLACGLLTQAGFNVDFQSTNVGSSSYNSHNNNSTYSIDVEFSNDESQAGMRSSRCIPVRTE